MLVNKKRQHLTSIATSMNERNKFIVLMTMHINNILTEKLKQLFNVLWEIGEEIMDLYVFTKWFYFYNFKFHFVFNTCLNLL